MILPRRSKFVGAFLGLSIIHNEYHHIAIVYYGNPSIITMMILSQEIKDLVAVV